MNHVLEQENDLTGIGFDVGPVRHVANADYVFGIPTVIPGASSFTSPSISTDGLSLYADSQQSGGYGGYDLYVFTRDTIHDDWSAPVNLGLPISSSYGDGNPDISADGLTLFFNSGRPGGRGGGDMWLATRATTDEPWSEPVNLGPPINGPYDDVHPSISADGLSLFFASNRPGGYGDRDMYSQREQRQMIPGQNRRILGPLSIARHGIRDPTFQAMV